MLLNILAIIASYFLGAVPWAFVCGKYFAGINIMKHGSGNVGTTNTFRVLGWKIGTLVFVLDIGKGFLSSYLGYMVGGTTLSVLCGVVAIFAHTFSIFLKFKGGKGVATSAGMLLFLSPWALIFSLLIWIVTALLTGYISVASIVAAVCSIFLVIAFDGTAMLCGLCAVVGCYIIFKHYSNIKRLMNGTENKVYWRKIIKRKS